jgi:hypothetical protein
MHCHTYVRTYIHGTILAHSCTAQRHLCGETILRRLRGLIMKYSCIFADSRTEASRPSPVPGGRTRCISHLIIRGTASQQALQPALSPGLQPGKLRDVVGQANIQAEILLTGASWVGVLGVCVCVCSAAAQDNTIIDYHDKNRSSD